MPTLINAAFLLGDCAQSVGIAKNVAVNRESPPERSPKTSEPLAAHMLASRNVKRAAGRKTMVAISAATGAIVTAASNKAGPWELASGVRTPQSVTSSLPASTAHK